LASVDVDEIRALPADIKEFPPGSWFVEVPAAGSALRVRKVWARGGDVSRQVETKPDRVSFFRRYQEMAQATAGAIQTLARACGAR